jgi:hypothetical protein
MVVAVAAIVLGLGACTEEGDTIVVNGLDCGLIYQDLAGDWAVTFTPDTGVTVRCSDPQWDGLVVDRLGVPLIYPDVVAFGSPSGVSFDVRGAGLSLGNELMASVEADSCLALVQTYESDDQGWVQCIGTMDLAGNFINGVCDSFDLDSDLDGFPDVACGLDHSFLSTTETPP